MRGTYQINNNIIIAVVKLRIMRWEVHLSCMGKVKNAYKISVIIPEGRRLLGRWEVR
jgi:hypothetical protein